MMTDKEVLMYEPWYFSKSVTNLNLRYTEKMKCRCFALSKQNKKKCGNIFAILGPWRSFNILVISHGIYSIWSHSNAFMSVEKRLVLGLSDKKPCSLFYDL